MYQSMYRSSRGFTQTFIEAISRNGKTYQLIDINQHFYRFDGWSNSCYIDIQHFCVETHDFYRRREDRYSKSTAHYIKREKTLVSLTEKLMGKIGL